MFGFFWTASAGTNYLYTDSDGDGCSYIQEVGPDPTHGGLRSDNNFWDFYDVWTRSSPTSPWVRDKVVNVPGDILGVARRFGSTRPGGPPTKAQALAEALVPPTSPDGYHADYDRGPLVGPNAWNLGPPDGAINVPVDILGVARQFGQSCVNQPQLNTTQVTSECGGTIKTTAQLDQQVAATSQKIQAVLAGELVLAASQRRDCRVGAKLYCSRRR